MHRRFTAFYHRGFLQKTSLVAVGILFSSILEPANAANVFFTGSSSSDWNTSANWNPAQLPGSADIAWINNGHSAVVSTNLTLTPSAVFVGSSAAGGTLSIASGGSLSSTSLSLGRANVDDAKTGTLNLNGGSLVLSNSGAVALQIGLNQNNLGSSEGIVNIYSGSISALGTVYVGFTSGGPAVGRLNFFGDAATFNVGSGNFWVTQNAGSVVKWDFYGRDNLTTITTNSNWRLLGGNTYLVDFANFSGASGSYSIKLIEGSGSINGNADAAGYFSFANTQQVSGYSVALANGKDLVLSFNYTAVPEPSTVGLLLLSLGAVMTARRRTRRANHLA